MKYLLGFLFLAGCAKIPKNKLDVQPELQKYVDSFVQDGNSIGRKIQIQSLKMFIEELPASMMGKCTLENNTVTVRIGKSYYDYFTQNNLTDDLEELVYHELGHCVLGLKHNETRGVNNFPVSIMVSYHFSGVLYKKYKYNYIRELFLGVPNNFEE